MLIQVTGLSKSFKSQKHTSPVLQNVSLGIPARSIYGLIGRSGAGKSTFLRCLNGLEEVDEGEVIFQGRPLQDLSKEALRQVRHQMGMIFQHFQLLKRRTALENVLLPLEFSGHPRKASADTARDCLRLVDLVDKAEAYPSELSGGQAQRVAIARALALETKVLLCDEPTSALDPQNAQDILSLLVDLNQKLGLTLVFITHDLSIVRDICTHVAVMEQGVLLESGDVETVFSRPQADITRTYIQSLLNSRLPKPIEEALSEAPTGETCEVALRLIFSGPNSTKPIISGLSRDLDLSINIAGGSLDHLGGATYGTLIITLPHDSAICAQVRSYLEARHVTVELLGYVP